jgi:hypothetical protein
MAIEELKSVFRPVTIRRERDAEDPRRRKKEPPPRDDGDEPPAGERGKVDIRV